jgi:hypothetical protein
LDEINFSINPSVTGLERNGKSHLSQNIYLFPNYPNPFNPLTTIPYTIGNDGHTHVDLFVYNILGQKIATLVSGVQKPGNNRVTWDASDFSSGVYYLRLQTDGRFVQSRKIMLIR